MSKDLICDICIVNKISRVLDAWRITWKCHRLLFHTLFSHDNLYKSPHPYLNPSIENKQKLWVAISQNYFMTFSKDVADSETHKLKVTWAKRSIKNVILNPFWVIESPTNLSFVHTGNERPMDNRVKLKNMWYQIKLSKLTISVIGVMIF